MIAADPYVLVTAAYNDGKFIDATIASVISQDVLPARWIIVSDGSTDDTDAIISKYTAVHDFIRLYRVIEDHPRNFAAQVHAINSGIARLKEQFPDKRFTFLLADTLDFAALEDFAFVEVFVNTACPRLGFDDAPRAFRPVLNLTDLRSCSSGSEPSRPPAPPP